MRKDGASRGAAHAIRFLSSLAQDFIEDDELTDAINDLIFLSSLAQDFIEEHGHHAHAHETDTFLSSLAQDFIEDDRRSRDGRRLRLIPELSSSGLH